jgi:hypothetical protein
MRAGLSEFFVEKARRELGEDESRREQALERFKEWIIKHPFIRGYPGGLDLNILSFIQL